MRREAESGGGPTDTPGSPLSVILPARNEGERIGTCLDALARQGFAGRLRVIVVPNGCTDATARIARARAATFRGPSELRVVELPECSKPAALNEGDRHALPGHRVYLDADAVLSSNALASMARVLDEGRGIHLCAPKRRFREPRSYVGRCYTRVWSAMPYVRNSIVFSGVYAVSREGRERWGEFPEIHSEDKFVRLHFRAEEQAQVEGASSEVYLPEGARRLFRARVRWCRGNGDLKRRFPQLTRSERRRYAGVLRALARRPDVWPDLPCYALLHAGASLVARLAPRESEHRWTR